MGVSNCCFAGAKGEGSFLWGNPSVKIRMRVCKFHCRCACQSIHRDWNEKKIVIRLFLYYEWLKIDLEDLSIQAAKQNKVIVVEFRDDFT